jgi:hypothetical protein
MALLVDGAGSAGCRLLSNDEGDESFDFGEASDSTDEEDNDRSVDEHDQTDKSLTGVKGGDGIVDHDWNDRGDGKDGS